MDIRSLRYFLAVAEAGHVTRAAAALGMQQPPLSLQLRKLEDELGVALLERHPKGVRLTDAGRLLADEARGVLTAFDGLRQRLREAARGKRGSLALGFTSSAAAHAFTPALLRECRQRSPQVRLEITEHNAAEITEAVTAGRLHAGLLRVPVGRPPGLQTATLLSEPALLALPRDHALAGRDAVPLAALHGEPLILARRPGAPGLYANLLALCEARGVHPRVVAEVERMMSNLNLVAAGLGLTVVPASMRGTHAHAVVYAALADARLDAPLTLVWHAAGAAPLSPVLVSFLALARELAAGADWA